MNDYGFDLWSSYMAGHLKGWVAQGGDMVAWAKFHNLCQAEIIGLTKKIVEIEGRVGAGEGPPGGLDVKTAFVVVWDHVTEELQTHMLEDILSVNAEAVANEVRPRYTILSIWESQAKAVAALGALQPLMRLS